jgi:hypothetical protein
VVRIRRSHEFPTRASAQLLFAHQSRDAVTAYALPSVSQLAMNPWAAVSLLALGEDCANLDDELAVLDGSARLFTLEPCVEATAPNLQHATKYRHVVLGLLRGDESKPHCFRLAKKAVVYSTGHRNTTTSDPWLKDVVNAGSQTRLGRDRES